MNDAADDQLKDANVMYALHFMPAHTANFYGIKQTMHSAKEHLFL